MIAAKEVHMYGRDADDTLDWIQEKDGLVSTEDYGHDLESVRTLISKHEGFEVCNWKYCKNSLELLICKITTPQRLMFF